MIAAPRASLLWKPVPAFTYSSVPLHGPKIAPAFGLTSPSEPSPELRGLSEVTENWYTVSAQPERRTKRPRPFDFGLRIHGSHRLTDLVLARRREPPAGGGSIQAHRVEPVTTQLHANRTFGVPIEEMAETPVGDPTARGDAPLGLLELIAIVRVVQEVGEVGEQVEPVAKQKARRSPRRRTVRPLKFSGDTLAMRLAAITVIQ